MSIEKTFEIEAADIPEAWKGQTLVLYDGHCMLCSRAVKFILKHESSSELKFAPLQELSGTDDIDFQSLVYYKKGKLYFFSDAALNIVSHLKWYWQWLQFGWIMPKFMRDGLYKFVAVNRRKWFGRSETCFMPNQQTTKRDLVSNE